MELFLNLVWAMVSLLLVVVWLRAEARARRNFKWSGAIALVLLIVLLFPAISMTDDLVAMNMPAEAEHMLRRSEASLAHTSVSWLSTVAVAMVLCVFSAASISTYCSLIRPRAFAATLRTVLVRTLGVRPPPAPVPAAV